MTLVCTHETSKSSTHVQARGEGGPFAPIFNPCGQNRGTDFGSTVQSRVGAHPRVGVYRQYCPLGARATVYGLRLEKPADKTKSRGYYPIRSFCLPPVYVLWNDDHRVLYIGASI